MPKQFILKFLKGSCKKKCTMIRSAISFWWFFQEFLQKFFQKIFQCLFWKKFSLIFSKVPSVISSRIYLKTNRYFGILSRSSPGIFPKFLNCIMNCYMEKNLKKYFKNDYFKNSPKNSIYSFSNSSFRNCSKNFFTNFSSFLQKKSSWVYLKTPPKEYLETLPRVAPEIPPVLKLF